MLPPRESYVCRRENSMSRARSCGRCQAPTGELGTYPSPGELGARLFLPPSYLTSGNCEFLHLHLWLSRVFPFLLLLFHSALNTSRGTADPHLYPAWVSFSRLETCREEKEGRPSEGCCLSEEADAPQCPLQLPVPFNILLYSNMFLKGETGGH